MPLERQIDPEVQSRAPLRVAAGPPPSAAGAVDRILSHTESAVASIVRRTEHQVREMAAEVDARSADQAAARCEQLARLRAELIERGSALAIHYEEILDQLDAVELALGALAGERGVCTEPGDQRIAAIKMTLRERQRISFAFEESPAPIEDDIVEATQIPRPTPVEIRRRRRWWHLWQREAA